jgi:hypothetical protein
MNPASTQPLDLLLSMFSTHLACQSHQTAHLQPLSSARTSTVNLQTITSFLRNSLPIDYPQPSTMGYSQKLSKDLYSQLFCGIGLGCERLSIPLLSMSNTSETFPVNCSYDIDSFIAKAQSLSVAQKGIRVQFCPNPLQNITQNIHLFSTIPETLLSGKIIYHQIPIHHIPHFRLGTILSTLHLPLYVFLPALYQKTSSPKTYINNQTLQQWMDIGFLPALHNHYSADVLQHLPTCFDSAYMEVYARSRESGIKKLNRNPDMGRRQEIQYFLPAERLEDVWQDMVKFSLKPGYTQFQNMFLLLDAKDLKLITKAESIKLSGERFWNVLSNDINIAKLDSSYQYLDIGQEIWSQEKNRVLLFKRCCTDNSIQHLKKEFKGLKTATYTWALNGLSANKTVEYSKVSASYQQGLIYSQSYSPLKCLFDAAGCYPLQNSSLDYLSLPPELIKSWQAAGPSGMGISLDFDKLKSSYIHSRDRILSALQGAMQRKMSFGVRQEHRLSSDLFVQLSSAEDRIQPCLISSSIWHFESQEVLQYLEANFLRFGLGLEYSFHCLQAPNRENTKDLSRLFRLFLQLQKASYSNVLLEGMGDIWRDDPIPNSKITYAGLGIRKQLQQFNFTWLPLDAIDWNTWRMGPKLQNTAAFEFIQIHSSALFKTNSLLQQRLTLETLDQFGTLLSHINNPDSPKTYRLLAYMGTMVIQKFRADIWTALEKFCECHWLDKELLPQAQKGMIPLDYKNILEFNRDRFARLQYSNKYKYSLQERWEVLFHWNDKWDRDDFRRVWKDWPFRLFFRKCYEQISHICGIGTAKSWEYLLVQTKFARSNFLLPSPSKNALLQRQTKKGEQAKIYWVPIQHNSWELGTPIRKLPGRNSKEDRWEFWEVDYIFPLSGEYEVPDRLYGEELTPEEIIEKVVR